MNSLTPRIYLLLVNQAYSLLRAIRKVLRISRTRFEGAGQEVTLQRGSFALSQSVYANVRGESEIVDDFAIQVAETPTLIIPDGGNRQHKRIVSAQPSSVTYGRALAYSDTYVSASGTDTFVYCRHKTDIEEFLFLFDNFFYERETDFVELSSREFKCYLNVKGRLIVEDVSFPLTTWFQRSYNLSSIGFIRLNIPFGDVSVQFVDTVVEHHNLLDYLQQRMMKRALEAPLFGLDASKSQVLVPLMTRVHWASEIIPKHVLNQIMQQFTANPSPTPAY